MCGIFGYIGEKENAVQIVLQGLKSLEYRGYDSWGVAVVPKEADSRIVVKKKAGKIGDANVDDLPPGSLAFGHTRWATHGGVTDINAHPHLDCTGKIAIIHNGIIENYAQIREKLVKLGHKFASETDSEVAVHLVEEYAKNLPFLEAVRRAFLEFEGLNAIIAVNSEALEFVAAKNGSPLVLGFGRKENFLASDAQALLSHTRKVYFLEDGELARVRGNKVELFDIDKGKAKKFQIQTLDWKIEEAEKGKYPYFMIKEIMEQPKVLRSISSGTISQIPDLAQLVKKSYGTYITGCGTASYAALSGTYLFSRIAHRHVNFALGSEFGYTSEFLTPKSLVIALSQSGETIDIIESVNKAKARGAKILAIVNNLGSTLYRMADYKILLGAGPEKCVLATKSFTAKIAILILLANALNGGLSIGRESIEKATKELEKILNKDNSEKIGS